MSGCILPVTTAISSSLARLCNRTLARSAVVLAIALGGLVSTDGRADAQSRDMVIDDVRGSLTRKGGLPLDVRSEADQLAGYYARSDATLLWLESGRSDELIAALAELKAVGLADLDARLELLAARQQALRSTDSSFLALVELTFSAAVIHIAEGLRLGQMPLYRDELHPLTQARILRADLVLSRLAHGAPVKDVLASVEPRYPEYRAIRAKLLQYQTIAARGGWAELRAGSDLKEGDRGPRVADLRDRLVIEGYLSPPGTAGDVFDAGLSEAVRRFQSSHNMKPSGTVDRRTLLALNIPVRDRIRQLVANLERWRWFEEISEGEYWVVNSNASVMEVRTPQGAADRLALAVDSGCEQRPAFDSSIGAVEFGPAYLLPAAVAGRYVLPILQSKPQMLDPSFVIHADNELGAATAVDWASYTEANFPFTIVQSPGPHNLLGSFRIPIAGDSGVSIHGRPAGNSKGSLPRTAWPACVAVAEGPEKTGAFLLRIGSQVARGTTSAEDETSGRAVLGRPIRILFHYGTVWLDPSGDLVFGPDPAGLDDTLGKKIIKRP